MNFKLIIVEVLTCFYQVCCINCSFKMPLYITDNSFDNCIPQNYFQSLALLLLQVELLQNSNRQDPNLKISAKRTHVEAKAVWFYYTEKDYDKLRVYIDAVTRNTFWLIYLYQYLIVFSIAYSYSQQKL